MTIFASFASQTNLNDEDNRLVRSRWHPLALNFSELDGTSINPNLPGGVLCCITVVS